MDHLDFIFQCFVHYSCVFYVQKCLLHAIWQISQLTFQKKRLLGPDHVQVFWKHKSIGNQAYDWLTKRVNQLEAWFPINLCFQNTYT